jgi:hypothetical protein
MELKKRGKFFLSIGNLQTFSDPDPEPKEEPKEEPKVQVETKLELSEDVQKYIQSEMDKVRTKAAKEKQKLKDELEAVKKDKMTDAEKAEYELQKQREELEKDRQELNRLKLEGATVDILKEVELDLDFKPFVLASDEDSTKVRAKTLKELFDKAVKAEVDKLYGENGRQIERSNGGFTNVTGNLKELALKNNIRTT